MDLLILVSGAFATMGVSFFLKRPLLVLIPWIVLVTTYDSTEIACAAQIVAIVVFLRFVHKTEKTHPKGTLVLTVVSMTGGVVFALAMADGSIKCIEIAVRCALVPLYVTSIITSIDEINEYVSKTIWYEIAASFLVGIVAPNVLVAIAAETILAIVVVSHRFSIVQNDEIKTPLLP